MGLQEEESDAILLRLLQRCDRQIDRPAVRFSSRRQASTFKTLAVTNVHELARELLATEKIIHSQTHPVADNSSMPMTDPLAKSQTTSTPAWSELEDTFRELHDLFERSDTMSLTFREQEHANLLMQLAVGTLTEACLSNDRGDLDASGVRVKLLEVAVRPTTPWRRLAFALVLNTSISALAALMSMQDDSIAQAQQLETSLFKVLREMLGKAVVVSATSLPAHNRSSEASSDWVEHALGCLEFFVKKANGGYSSDRLRALDDHTLLFLVAEASNRGASGTNLQQKAMELVIATMYAFKVVPGAKASDWQSSTKDHTVWNCGLPLAVVEQYISIELLLYHFYNAPVVRKQRLVCMVLVDLACEQMRRTGSREAVSVAGLDQIWRAFLTWEDPPQGFRHSLLTPYVSTARLAKQLAPSCSLVPEKHLIGFLNQFRQLAQVDDYFGPNPSLAKAIVVAKKSTGTSIGAALIDQMSKQLTSSLAVERFRGERWLAELLAYGHDDVFSSYGSQADTVTGSTRNQSEVFLARPTSTPSKSSPTGEELEETFCYDEGGEVGVAAQAKFWSLISPTSSVELRVSFTRVLDCFVRRKLQRTSGRLDPATVQEINTCMRVVVEYNETEPAVLVPIVLSILDICQRELSYIDKRKQQQDSNGANCHRIAWSDSLASRVLNGEIALDQAILKQLDSEFFLHVLRVLFECPDLHSSLECRRVCCGVGASLVGDVAACTALIVTTTLSDNNEKFLQAGGLPAMTPFLQACDTRIAVLMAKFIGKKVKQIDEAQYAAFLRELYVACVEADDERALYNSYLHTQTLLHDFSDRIET